LKIKIYYKLSFEFDYKILSTKVRIKENCRNEHSMNKSSTLPMSSSGSGSHPGSRLNRIDRILIPSRYTFFFSSPPVKNSGLSVLDPEKFQDG
jgi:hypothetical protein